MASQGKKIRGWTPLARAWQTCRCIANKIQRVCPVWRVYATPLEKSHRHSLRRLPRTPSPRRISTSSSRCWPRLRSTGLRCRQMSSRLMSRLWHVGSRMGAVHQVGNTRSEVLHLKLEPKRSLSNLATSNFFCLRAFSNCNYVFVRFRHVKVTDDAPI